MKNKLIKKGSSILIKKTHLKFRMKKHSTLNITEKAQHFRNSCHIIFLL